MKKHKKLVIIFLVAFIFALSILPIYHAIAALGAKIEYDYVIDAKMPNIVIDDKVIKSTGEVEVLKCDIIYDDNGELLVRKDVEFTDGEIVTSYDNIVKVLPLETKYLDGEKEVTVNYKNEYIYSVKDLEIANLGRAYNNIFEYLADTTQSKSHIQRTVCFMQDITILQDFTINYPCSLQLLTSNVNLVGKLIIENDNKGTYYISTDGGKFKNYILNGEDFEMVENPESVNFIINAPFSNYIYDPDLLLVDNSNTLNRDALIDEALVSADTKIPKYITKNIILEPKYKTYGINFSYEIADAEDDAEFQKFNGLIEDYVGTHKKVKITASCGENSKSTEKDVYFVSVDNGDYVTDALEYLISENYTAQDLSIGLMIDGYLEQIFGDSLPDGKNLAIFMTDNAFENVSEKMMTKITGKQDIIGKNQDDNYAYTLISGDITDINIGFKKDIICLADKVYLYIVYSEEDIDTDSLPETDALELNLEKASYDEIIYYLKDKTPAFITNEKYRVLNVNGNNICAGSGANSAIISSTLGIKSITNEFVGKNTQSNATLSDTQIKNLYFGDMKSGYYYQLLSSSTIIDSRHSINLEYTVTFNDDTVRTFQIPVYRAALGAGGESEMFTSDNQLAAYFIDDKANWLAPKRLNLEDSYYTKIEISKINGIDVSAVTNQSLLDMVTLEGDDILTDTEYYKSYDILVNPNYVPDENTSITVHCVLYNADTENDINTSEYDYSFIVPGILKCSTNGYCVAENWEIDADKITPYTFTDNAFYTRISNILGEEYTALVLKSRYGEGGYQEVILSSAKNFEGEKIDVNITKNMGVGNITWTRGSTYDALIFTTDLDKQNTASGITNVKGIEVFEKIEAVVLDYVKILPGGNIYDFSACNGLNIKYLSAINCDLNNEKIFNENVSSLSGLYMTYVNLANNGIDTTQNLLMRTVEYLDLSSNNIGEISPLTTLTEIRWLDISNNHIMRFEPLKQLELLKTVFTTQNQTSYTVGENEITDVYGSMGKINIPVYVWIMKTNSASVYVSDGDISVVCGGGEIFGYNLSDNEIEGSVALNAFASPKQLNDTEVGRLVEDMKHSWSSDDGIQVNDSNISYSFKFVHYDTTESLGILLYRDGGLGVQNGDTCYYKVAIYDGENRLAEREFCVVWNNG